MAERCNVPMVGESIPNRLVDELNRRISKVELIPGVDDDGDVIVKILDVKIGIVGGAPADMMLHVELLCEGYEHTLFVEELPLTRLSKGNQTKSRAFQSIRYETQKIIDDFLKELAENTNRGAYGRAMIHPSFCA